MCSILGDPHPWRALRLAGRRGNPDETAFPFSQDSGDAVAPIMAACQCQGHRRIPVAREQAQVGRLRCRREHGRYGSDGKKERDSRRSLRRTGCVGDGQSEMGRRVADATEPTIEDRSGQDRPRSPQGEGPSRRGRFRAKRASDEGKKPVRPADARRRLRAQARPDTLQAWSQLFSSRAAGRSPCRRSAARRLVIAHAARSTAAKSDAAPASASCCHRGIVMPPSAAAASSSNTAASSWRARG
jgi:hypothetical protein